MSAGGSAAAGAAGTGGGAGATNSGGASGDGGAASTCCELGQCPCGGQAAELGRGVVPMHRLRSAEYHKTLTDLLGVEATSPVPDEEKPYEAQITDVTPWLSAITHVTEQLFDVPVGPVSPPPFDCVFPAGADRECAAAIVDAFGLHAFRRPVLDQEKVAFLRVYDDLRTTDGPHVAVVQMVRAMLLSPAFLFHVELSDDPDGDKPERLDSYALAARLSFALWRSTPDAELLQAAKNGLSDDAALGAAFDRVTLADRAGTEEADGLVDVWLGADRLAQHEVDPDVFPDFNAVARIRAIDDERAFLRLFMVGNQPFNEVLTLQQGERTGALGQAAILTLTSTPRRTSATLRGKYVVERLLCQDLPVPPAGGSMDLGADYPAGRTERQALEAAVAQPTCQSCHGLVDPLGYALGNYDALGQYRTVDASSQAIDARVTLPSALFPAGSVNGLTELAGAITGTDAFRSCVAQQLSSYLIHREVTKLSDPDLLARLAPSFAAKATLHDLTRSVVMSDPFRYRRPPALVAPP